MVLSEIFLTMLVTSCFAFLAGALAVCYKSKCVRISCCGLVIDRDVAGEEKIDEEEIDLRRGNQPPTVNV
jgi:hypothetical protein